MKSPAFQFYAADWLASQRVQLMTLEEEGAYIRLLCYCWLHGSLPADPVKLSALMGKGGSTTLATTVSTMFQPHGDRLVHERLEAERAKQENWRKKSAEGGKKSAELRTSTHTAQRVVEPPHQGSLPNGTNQKATLQSSVFSLQSSDLKQERAKPTRFLKRNELIDALASLDCANLAEVTNWSKHAKALQIIRTVTPEVDAVEIRRRARNYVSMHPDWPLTSTALANNWGPCAGNNANGRPGPSSPDIYREPEGWRQRAANKWPGVAIPATWAELSPALRNDLIPR